MQSLLVQMYQMEERRKSGEKVSPSVKIDNNSVVQKFTEIKEEILTCQSDDQIFLLTKEMIYACRNYHSIKKKVCFASLLWSRLPVYVGWRG